MSAPVAISLRPHQLGWIADVQGAFRTHRRVLGQCPTGFGKTACATVILRDCTARGLRSLFVCELEEIALDTHARLRGVRVCSGDWSRVLGPSSLWAHVRTSSTGVVGVYLDPPYSEGSQQYAAGGTGTGLSAEVRAWALKHGAHERLRIVLSGYEGEHDELEAAGWRVVDWKTKGGYSSAGGENANQKRERLWLSPHCVGARQRELFGGVR